MVLFERVSYHISESLPERTREEVSLVLESNGAVKVAIDSATHIISDTVEFEGCDIVRESIFLVTPFWVQRSMELGQLQDPKYFSANKAMFFSGVVACSADLLIGDKEVIASGILAEGGAWREGLTRDVTHLFVTNTRSDKYRTAMHFRDSAHITVLLPQWFDQCWSMQMRLPTEVFQFPDPPYLRGDHDSVAYKAQMLVKGDRKEKSAFLHTINVADHAEPPVPRARDIWQGRRVLLAESLELDAQRRESVEDRIRQAGGTVVLVQDGEEAAAVEQADVLITRFRTGAAYNKALADGKTIGTLAWLFNVERTGVVTRPRDQLLHYPVRSKPIEGFSDHVITVTNYQGQEREYLKKLIEVMGAKFTPTMSGRNTIVVAAFKQGDKTAKAELWSVPVVSHKWLEDCFVHWRNLTPAQKKYVDYAPGVNYGTLLGERGIGRIGLAEDPELPPVEMKKKEKVAVKKGSEVQEAEVNKKVEVEAQDKDEAKNRDQAKNKDGEGVTGTTSVREALEVKEVEDVLELGAPFSPGKVGPPRGAKKTQSKIADAGSPSVKPVSKPKPTSGASIIKDTGDGVVSSPTKGADRAHKDGPSVQLPPGGTDGKGAPLKVDPPVKSKSKPKPNSKLKPVVEPEDDESVVEVPPPKKKPIREDDEDVAPDKTQATTLKPKPKPKLKAAFSRNRLPSSSGSDRESDNDVGRDRKKGIPREGDVGNAKTKPRSKPVTPNNKARAMTPRNIDDSDDENTGAVRETRSRVTPKTTPKVYKSKVVSKARALPESENGSESDVEVVPPKRTAAKALGVTNKGKGRAAPQPSPNCMVSVDLPDPRSLFTLRSPPPPRSTQSPRASPRPKRSPTKPSKALTKTHSVLVSAHEAHVSSPKRGRAAVRRDSTSSLSTPSPRRSPRRPAAETRHSVQPSPRSGTVVPIGGAYLQRFSSRRSAAAAASQRLRDEVMPDVMSYQQERRRGPRGGAARRRRSSNFNEDDEGDTDRERVQKKRRLSDDHIPEKAKGTKTKRLGRNAPPDRFVTHVAVTKRLAEDDDDDPGPSKRTDQGRARKKTRIDKFESEEGSESEAVLSRSSCDPKKIRILKTKIDIPEDIEAALAKIGLKFTQKPQECTHLVTNTLARTEKFLCALPNAPFVLNKDWLVACAESKSVVAEHEYTLRDPDMEHKHKFKLVDALQRAKELKRRNEKLLQGHFFYITPGVPLDIKMLKNVIKALGAECKETTPTVRNLSATRHIISCLKDEPLWRPLAKHGFPVYSHEFILMAAFTQYVDWDDEDKLLAVSA